MSFILPIFRLINLELRHALGYLLAWLLSEVFMLAVIVLYPLELMNRRRGKR